MSDRKIIYADDAINALAKMMPKSYTPDGSHPADEEIFRAQEIFADCIKTIKILPPAQPDVIHCCECKYWKPGYITDDDDFVPPGCAVGWVPGVWRATDYCSNAERRQGALN